ncbi:MAG: hypothetical protein OHK0046_14200 [Anaerolineae bacterium]
MKKRLLLLLAFVMMVVGSTAAQEETAEPISLDQYDRVLLRLLQELLDPDLRALGEFPTYELIANGDDPLYIAPLLDIAYFTRSSSLRTVNTLIFESLMKFTEQDFGTDWRAYYEWASANDVALPPSYDLFKGALLATAIDPDFARFFDDVQATAQINLLEVVWGGVAVDGIPSLVNARQISPQEAVEEGRTFVQYCRNGDCRYPEPDEYVFGVSINGDNRAYPLRLLNWHEMFNDVIGRAPLYAAPDGEEVCQFRAPVQFTAVQRQGDAWVRVTGESAGCPAGGWLANPETLIWEGGTWAEVRDALPDSDADALDPATSAVFGQVDGLPVMLAYCTLCGSGILYNPTIDNLMVEGENLGTVTLEFGSSGLLMRSNKLMYDRTTDTVWNAITGEPAFGALAESGIQLERLPVVVTDWRTWLEEHPDTSVLSLNTGYDRDYRNGAAYSDYFNDPNFVMFPVWQQDVRQQENKDVIFALLLEDTPKAYPLATIIPEQVTNDTLAGVNLVIVSRETPRRQFFEPGGASVRAYERGEHTFSPGENHTQITDENGVIWRVTEEALVHPDGDTLPRLPGHLAFWFGWYGFYPETLVYGDAPVTE